MNLLAMPLAVCLVAYCAYALLSVWGAWGWRRAKPTLSPDWTPKVTLLKPVRGLDPEAYANFASFCRLDYPLDRVQWVFGALDPDDPALVAVRQLQSDFPLLDIQIVSSSTELLQGYNRKVCNLSQMLPHAKNDILVIADSDMRVTPDYLRRVVAPLERGVGLVTCPYKGYHPKGFAATWEALGIGADFMPSVMVSRVLEGVSYAFGSTIVLSKLLLEEMGGFEAMKNQLADDYALGNGAKRLGREVVISDYITYDTLGREGFREMWARRVRWGRTLRFCRPAGYLGSFITHGFALATLHLLATRFSLIGWEAWAGILAFRLIVVGVIARFFMEDEAVLRSLYLIPFSDLLSFVLFVCSLFGNTILWRGERLRVVAGGSLMPLAEK